MIGNVHVLPKWVVWFFFWLGLTAAVCIRALMLISRHSPEAAEWVWRFAMVSYTFFFGYRFLIGRRRRRIIIEHKLIDELERADGVSADARQAALYILNSIVRSKELVNYGVICILSILALLLDFLLA